MADSVGDDQPAHVKLWGCLGFGRFLLIMVIKSCTRSLLIAKGYSRIKTPMDEGVDIYLKCSEQCSLAFYTNCGFVRINGVEETGDKLLPKIIAATLKVGDRKSILLVPETTETIYAAALIQLEADCLLHPRMKDEATSSNTEVNPGMEEAKRNSDTKLMSFVWCFFPRPMLKGPAGEPHKMTASDLEELLERLPLVHALLPKHSSMSLRLLSPKEIPI